MNLVTLMYKYINRFINSDELLESLEELDYGGYAVSDDGHKDGDDTCAEGAGEPCDGEYVASDDGVVRHAGRQTPIGDIRNGINNAPKNVNNGNDDKGGL